MPTGTEDIDSDLNNLSSGLGIPALKSSVRQAILMSLAINRKMKFTELMRLTGAGKGSLWNHLDQMVQAGLVARSKVSYFTSPRIYVEITKKGMQVYEELLGVISRIAKQNILQDAKMEAPEERLHKEADD